MIAIFDNPFIQTAFIAALLASIASGVIGSYVVIKRTVFITGSIAHSVLGGMGFFLWLNKTYHIEWLDPLYGAFLASILSAWLIGWIHLKFKQRKDAVIASVWSSGMAIGVIFISLTPGYTSDLMNFLFGNILWISKWDLWMLGVLDVIILLTVGFYYNRFLLICFDEEQAKLNGLPTTSLYFLLLTLIALSVVLLIQIIGIILVLALLSLPPMIAGFFTKRLISMMIVSILLTIFFSTVGLFVSFELNWPIGATIALVCAFSYILTINWKKRFTKPELK